MKTLFVGCSHTMGYQNSNITDPVNVWKDNNYAEIYSELFSKDIIIAATAGVGNEAYPNFVAHLLKKYSDISEIFIQSTYWGRFPIAVNPDLDDKKIFPLDFFIQKDISSPNIQRYSLGFVQQEKYLETWIKPEFTDYNFFPYVRDTSYMLQPDSRRSSHMYFRMWHYNNTHLIQQEFMKNIAFIDLLSREKNIKVFVWNINDRCYIPKETLSFYTNLTQTKIANIDAITFLQSKGFKNLNKIDGEHYTKNVHELIAKHYLAALKTTQYTFDK